MPARTIPQTNWLHKVSRLFTDTSEHIRFFYFLVFLFSSIVAHDYHTVSSHLEPDNGHVIDAACLSFLVEHVEMFAGREHDLCDLLTFSGGVRQHWSERCARHHVTDSWHGGRMSQQQLWSDDYQRLAIVAHHLTEATASKLLIDTAHIICGAGSM